MASKITRKTAVIFAGSALAQDGGIAQFGSLANNTPIFSIDPAVIQALPQWLGGWNSALVAGDAPALEDDNAVDFVHSRQIAYLLQQGIAEWDVSTYYFINSICSYLGQIFISSADTNIGHAPNASSAYWQLLISAAKGENIVRNGGMQIYQRGTSGTVSSGNTNYTLDGWMVSAASQNVNWSVSNNFLYLLPVGGSTNIKLIQRIEAATLSGAISQCYNTNGAASIMTFQALISVPMGSYVIPTLSINVPTSTINDFSSVTQVVSPITLQEMTGNYQVVSVTIQLSLAVDWTKGAELVLDFGNIQRSSGQFVGGIYVANVDFSPTPFLPIGLQSNPPTPQIRTYQEELVICSSYYQRWGGEAANQTLFQGFTYEKQNPIFLMSYQKMRSIPTLSYSAISDFLCLNSTDNSSPASLVLNKPGTRSSELIAATNSDFNSIGVGCFLQTNNTTAVWLALSAEL